MGFVVILEEMTYLFHQIAEVGQRKVSRKQPTIQVLYLSFVRKILNLVDRDIVYFLV